MKHFVGILTTWIAVSLSACCMNVQERIKQRSHHRPVPIGRLFILLRHRFERARACNGSCISESTLPDWPRSLTFLIFSWTKEGKYGNIFRWYITIGEKVRYYREKMIFSCLKYPSFTPINKFNDFIIFAIVYYQQTKETPQGAASAILHDGSGGFFSIILSNKMITQMTVKKAV